MLAAAAALNLGAGGGIIKGGVNELEDREDIVEWVPAAEK